MNRPAHIDAAPERLRRRLRVEDFELLADGGAFADSGKTELIDGDIYCMNAQWARHGQAKVELLVALANRLRALGSGLRAYSEVSVRVADDSMPEPDIVLTAWRGDRAIPGDTVALAIEVSDTTLDVDLGRKARLYAAAGIPEYWVADMAAARIVIHTVPAGGDYRERREVGFGAPLAAVTVAGLDLGVVALID